ncbi:hypothetical protein F5Y10DRAFT_55047 [Nemania abortiva]|nr:hypothetical protein F5Y10DRAFT_55047 [Nemania abortiva]
MFYHSFVRIYKFLGNAHALIPPQVWGVSAPVEIIPAAVCSLAATYYTIREGLAQVPPTYEARTIFGAIPLFTPSISHGLLLASCLGLGCCVSSYRHRARGQEPYQGIVFLVWVVWVGLVGLAIDCEVDTILVAMMPWALIAGMLSSYLGHMSARRLLLRVKADAESNI